MSQFDETTEKKAEQWQFNKCPPRSVGLSPSNVVEAFQAGRNSVKPSLAIAIKALREELCHCDGCESCARIDDVLAEITANGDMIGVEA